MKKILFPLLVVSMPFLKANEPTLDVQTFLNVAAGASSISEEELATHAHDPNQNFNLQGFEVNMNARWSDQIMLNVRMNNYLSLEDELESELEEAFLELKALPLGLNFKGGRFLPKVGLQNDVHLHAWDFVNASLNNTQFLGEEGLLIDGAELSKKFELGASALTFSTAYGAVVEHDHEEEEGGDHDHGSETTQFNANSQVFSFQADWDYAYSDTHQYKWLVSTAVGQNGYRGDRDSLLVSSDWQYSYDSNGYDKGGQKIQLTGSWYYRDVEWAHEEDDDPFGSNAHIGLGAGINYSWNDAWQLASRIDYIDGLAEGYVAAEDEHGIEIEEVTRYSLALTRHFTLPDAQNAMARLQVDMSDLESGDQEQSIWLQFGWSWSS